MTFPHRMFPQFTLQYVISTDSGSQPATALTDAFQKYHSQKYKLVVAATSVLVLIFSTLLIILDVNRFSGLRLTIVLCLRLVVIAPLTLSVSLWTFTPSFERHTQWLALPTFLLGAAILTYAIVGKDPGYGTLAVYIVFLYR